MYTIIRKRGYLNLAQSNKTMKALREVQVLVKAQVPRFLPVNF